MQAGAGDVSFPQAYKTPAGLVFLEVFHSFTAMRDSGHFYQYGMTPPTVRLEDLGDSANFLKEELQVSVLLYNGRAIDVDLPNFVEVEITECEPGVKGDTVQGGTKPATVETGAVVLVPLFVDQGERIRVDTRTGEYASRVK